MSRARVLVSWSGGKDSAWALHELRRRDDVEIVGLVTTFSRDADRVAMHAVRRSLIEAQARAVDVPLHPVFLPHPCSNAEYEAAFGAALIDTRDRLGVVGVAYGDLFLADIRAYRERHTRATGLEPIFPIWGLATNRLAREMVDGGVMATLTCVDPRQVSDNLAGRRFDAALLADLPPTADPCGENGEFHTYVTAGPMFRDRIRVSPGRVVRRDGFVFADLLPEEHVENRIAAP